ncbi:MAG: recombinase family protein, partial [Deltaproteobacteria bacterium]|nr:recombinase family protein [Deltaproteobacteria bacterium]
EVNLFFAIFPRVSTEAQAEKGESLEVQTKAMEQAVAKFGGEIVANYGGQEHSTPDYEHKRLELLIQDSYLPFEERGWNAIMFYDHSRWSRDNNKASDYIEKLKSNRIRFFTITQEWILTNPEHRLILGINSVTNEYQAMIQTEKMMKSRIARAKDGRFTAGQPPFGRRRDKDGYLHIIEEDKKLIETAARLYLDENLGFIKIGKRLNKAPSVIQRALLHYAGNIYIQEFNCERLGIHERIRTKIPPTLDAITRKFIAEEAEKRRVYHPGRINSDHLLSGFLFCDDCGKRLTVQEQQTNRNGNVHKYLYYRHPKGECGRWRTIQGELIEELVMESIIEILSNSKKFKEALLKPHPAESERKSLERDLLVLNDSIEKIKKQEANLINAIMDGVELDGLEERANKLKKDKKELLKSIEEIKSRLSNVPTEKEIKDYRRLLLKQIEKLDLNNLSVKEKRELIKMFCQGRDRYFDRPNGIYIGESEDRLGFNLQGLIGGTLGYISESDSDLDTFIDEDSVNVEELRLKPLMNSFNSYTGSLGYCMIQLLFLLPLGLNDS